VPPDTDTVADPFATPKQFAWTTEVLSVIEAFTPTVTDVACWHPLASVTVTE
jgi:hypothetical protein